jgi:hypothetical protein
VAVNASASQQIGSPRLVVDANAAEILDANGLQVVVEGDVINQTATGAVAAVAGEVDGVVNGVIPAVTQSAASFISIGAVGSATIAVIALTATGSTDNRNGVVLGQIAAITGTIIATAPQIIAPNMPGRGDHTGVGSGGGRGYSDSDYEYEWAKIARKRMWYGTVTG